MTRLHVAWSTRVQRVYVSKEEGKNNAWRINTCDCKDKHANKLTFVQKKVLVHSVISILISIKPVINAKLCMWSVHPPFSLKNNKILQNKIFNFWLNCNYLCESENYIKYMKQLNIFVNYSFIGSITCFLHKKYASEETNK